MTEINKETIENTDAEVKEETAAEQAGGEISEETPQASGEAETEAQGETEESPEENAEEAGAENPEENAEEAGAEDPGDNADDDMNAKTGNEKKGKKKAFFKKEKKDKKDEKIEELTDRLQRQMAEFDNFRKRTEKEKASMYQIGAKDVIEKLLPVIDNFERGLETGDASDPFVDGMNKIYKQMLTMLTELGVTPIEAVGQPFDPNLHNAVMHIDDENAGENVVVEEFQKGYLYKDAVVRYSMVKVAN